MSRAHPPAPEPLLIGRYALFSEIASGGMATVHLGRLLGPVGFSRIVAIKRLLPHLSRDPEFVTMFLDEARIAARIRHPNAVQTLDVVAEGGELFLVMDYIEGESVARLLRATLKASGAPPPTRITAAVLCGALHGLHAAHEANGENGELLGVVHRDISPQNILVGTDGVPRVIDFGVAKAVGRMQTTRVGQLKGKVGYMAPEQVRFAAVTRRTDVYAAGVVLWECLTGARLFPGDEAAVVGRILAGDAPAPSQVFPGVPNALDEVVLRALHVDPAARYESAREMALALEAAVAVASVSEVSDWVTKIASEPLMHRAAQVAALESPEAAPAAPPAPSDDPPPRRTETIEMPTVHAAEPKRTEPTRVAPPRGRWRAGSLLAAGASLAAAATLGALIASRWAPGAPPAEARPTDSPPASTVSASTTSATAAVSAERAPPPEQGPPEPPATRPIARQTPASSGAHHGVASARPDDPCAIPYYYDSEGLKRYKPGCVK